MAKFTIGASDNMGAKVGLALAGLSFPAKVKVSSDVAQRVSLPVFGLFLSSYQKNVDIHVKTEGELKQVVHELQGLSMRISPGSSEAFSIETEDAKPTPTPEEPMVSEPEKLEKNPNVRGQK